MRNPIKANESILHVAFNSKSRFIIPFIAFFAHKKDARTLKSAHSKSIIAGIN